MKNRWLTSAFIALLLATLGEARGEEKPQGFMWNKTGLPLVFPLQVKSLAGQDYFMILKNVEDETPALAAYVRGGVFFRVLVPPGIFKIDFAAGEVWQNEEALFGPDATLFFTLPDPLTFAVLDESTKGGHIIDLRNMSPDSTQQIIVTSAKICQNKRAGNDAQRLQAEPSARDTDPVGQEILERRFLEGATVFEVYNRERQQENLDPPVLALPKVPLRAPPSAKPVVEPAPAQQRARLYERPC